MNKMVNTNFTGDNLSKLKDNGLVYDQEKEIFEDLERFLTRKEFVRHATGKKELTLVQVILNILAGVDNNEEYAKFLDEIDSVLIYHKDLENMTPRELACYYMNRLCDWSIIFKNDYDIQNDRKAYSINKLYAGLKHFVLDELGYSKRKLWSYTDFREHLRHHAVVKPSHYSFNGINLTAESVCGLDHKKFF